MPRQNPFLRRASSPGDIHYESNMSNRNHLLSVPPPLPNAHPAKLTQASLSDSALKVPIRPLTFRNTQSRTISIRPSRFIKPATPMSSMSSPIILNDTNTLKNTANSNEMTRFVRLFDTFTQKLYIEGYLMRHNNGATSKTRTKMFVELSGSTLTLWDTEVPGSTIMPGYFQVIDTTRVYSKPTVDSNNKKKHIFLVQNKKTTLMLEASDEPTMVRWVCAMRLACFEKQKLHQLFTLKLLLHHPGLAQNASSASLTSTASDDILPSSKSTWLQVRVPGTSIWQKYWVVLTNKKKKDDRQKSKSSQQQQQHLSKMFGKKHTTAGNTEEHILLFETKKSKTPMWTLSHLTQAYAVYPESCQLIEKGSMIRLDGQIKSAVEQNTEGKTFFTDEDDDCCCWFMADQSPLTIQWLLAVYDTFKLYGRPETLLNDSKNKHSLNFGEPVQDISNVVHPKLFLETDEAVQCMDVSLLSRQKVESFLLDAIVKKQQLETSSSSSLSTVTVTRRPTGTRSNSLPLITVISAPEDVDETQKSSNDSLTNVSSLGSPTISTPFRFAHQVADSSDESEDEDELENEDEEQDSDDEPIGMKTNHSPTTASSVPTPLQSPTKKTFANSLIPDFDFGNGFDVPKNVTSAGVAVAVTSSSLSQTLPTRGKKQGSRHRSSMTLFMDTPNTPNNDDSNLMASNFSSHARKTSMPATMLPSREQRSASSSGYHSMQSTPTPQAQPPLSSLFGDFSIGADFGKFLDEPSIDQRKYSLPANAKFSSIQSSRSTSSSNYHTNRWDQECEDEDELVEKGDGEEEEDQPQHPSDEDDRHSYDSDFDGPLIPSLGDHFAPQNSLLDTYLGEQLSAKEQVEYAKATGQPLIQVSTKKEGAPRGGLVGMISQREKDRKEGNGLRVAELVNQHHVQIGQDRFEREKERRILEQRQHQFLKHQVTQNTVLSGKKKMY